MKRLGFVFVMTVVAVLPVSMLAQSPAATKPATPPAKPAAQAPAAAGGVTTIELTANDMMKFDKVALTAKPGEKVKVVLKNIGTMPKMAMAHNFVLLKVGTDATKFANESVMAAATEYIPASMKAAVVAHTSMAGPAETVEVTFDVPKAPGAYPFLCSFAGHFAAGMKGTLTVK